MARYTIDFSTNASYIVREIEKVNTAIAQVARTGKGVEITLNTASLGQQISTTFKQIDKEIAKLERRLRKVDITGPDFGSIAESIGKLQGTQQKAMMQKQVAGLRGQASAFVPESAVALNKELQATSILASQIAPNTEAWVNLQREIARINIELKATDKLAENVQLSEQMGAFAPGSLNALEAKLTILRNKAREISPDTTEWKALNKEIVKVEQSVERQTRRPLTKGQRFGAAGGAFLYGGGLGGGVGSAVGGIAGGLAGGVPGAFTGAAIGQTVDNATAITAAMTNEANEIKKLQIGLASASSDLQDYGEATRMVEQASQKLLIPLEQAYRKFTQLKASASALGIENKIIAELFEGTASAVLKTGGSMEDVDGAMRAVVQILSKGKVQAEELRGQLGERFPGAVVKFAQANKIAVQDLDAAFQSGQVSIDQFIKFARANFKDGQKYVDELATSSEYAGDRMSKAFEKLRLNIGNSLQPTGALIQDFVTQSIGQLDRLIAFLIENKIIIPGPEFFVQQALAGGGIAQLEQQKLALEAKRMVSPAGQVPWLYDLINPKDVQEAKALEAAVKRLKQLREATGNKPGAMPGSAAGQEEASKKFLDVVEKREESIANARQKREEELADIRKNAIRQVEELERRYSDQRLQSERELDRVRREMTTAMQEQSLLGRELAAGLTGENPAVIESQRQAGEIVSQFTEEKIAIENDAQDRRLRLDRELEDFKRANADAINKANERYATAIGEIQKNYAKSVAKLIEDGSGNGAKRLAAAGKLLNALISQSTAAASFQSVTGKSVSQTAEGLYQVTGYKPASAAEMQRVAGLPGADPAVAGAIKAYIKASEEVDKFSKELKTANERFARPTEIQAESVNTADLEARIQTRQQQLETIATQVDNTNQALNVQQNLINKTLGSFKEVTDEARNGVVDLIEQNNVLKQQINMIDLGMLPSLAAENAKVENTFKLAQQRLGAIHEAEIATGKLGASEELLTAEYETQKAALEAQEQIYYRLAQTARDRTAILEAARIQREAGFQGAGLRAGFINEAGTAYQEQLMKGVSPDAAAQVAKATEQMTIAKTTAESLQSAINGIGDAFGSAMTSGVASLVDGTATAKQVFADFLKSVGQALLQAAGQMISTYVAIGIAKIFAGLGGGGGGNPAGSGGGISNLDWGAINTYGAGLQGFANGGVAKGGFVPFRAFANGGTVSGPTLGLVGEGKYNEAVVPLPDGRSIPVSMKGGRSARDVMGNNAPGMPQAPTLNMKFETTRINGVDYVSKEQLEQAMAETRRSAISGGARQGMELTLDRIKQSPSTRARIGIR